MKAQRLLLPILLVLASVEANGDIDRKLDSIIFSIHVDIAAQLDADQLDEYLETAGFLLHSKQHSSDVACCSTMESIDLEVFGTPGDGLDIIDSQGKWNQLGSRKAFVWDITWCDGPGDFAGCAELPGQRMAVALSTSPSLLPTLIAHERGHNAGLSHRGGTCALMNGIISILNYCVNAQECTSFRSLGSDDGLCTCMGPTVGDPPLADGAMCSVDTQAGYCKASGVCFEGVAFPHQKVSDTEGGFTGELSNNDNFGMSAAALGDLDGDGIDDLAVGASTDEEGAIWILFLNADGTLASQQKIGEAQGGFSGPLDYLDRFGISVASLGDLDGDGVGDLGVGATGDDDGGSLRGAVWILFLNSNGTVKSRQKISDTAGNFGGTLDDLDLFGISVAPLGDLDGDDVADLAVGAKFDDDGGSNRGAVWILLLHSDGTVKSQQKISDTAGGFAGALDDQDTFGASLSFLGDLDGDGVGDLAVGAPGDDDGGPGRGATWILFLHSDGTVDAHQKVSATQGGLSGPLDDGVQFGSSLASIGDLDGDGVGDLAVGIPDDVAFGEERGALWLLFLESDGTVKGNRKIGFSEGGFLGLLDSNDNFGQAVASLGNLVGAGSGDLAVGAYADDDGGAGRGAVWILFTDGGFCSDGILNGDEQCDDDNFADGDGCSRTCQIEVKVPLMSGWSLVPVVVLMLAAGCTALQRRQLR